MTDGWLIPFNSAQTVAKLQETKGTTKKEIEDALTGMPFVSALMSKVDVLQRRWPLTHGNRTSTLP